MFPVSRALDHMKTHFQSSFAAFSKLVDLESCSTTAVLDSLCEHMLASSSIEFSVSVCASFRPILLDLVSRVLSRVSSAAELERAVISVVLPALRLGPSCLLNVVLEHLRELAPLSLFDRVGLLALPELRLLCRAAHDLLSVSMRFASCWSWAPILALVNQSDEEVRFFAAASSALYLRMSDAERRQFGPLNASAHLRLSLVSPPGAAAAANVPTFEWDMTVVNDMSDSRLVMSSADLFSSVVSVCGILLPRRREATAPTVDAASSKLVYTNSAVRNLQAIALALARGRPVVVAVGIFLSFFLSSSSFFFLKKKKFKRVILVLESLV